MTPLLLRCDALPGLLDGWVGPVASDHGRLTYLGPRTEGRAPLCVYDNEVVPFDPRVLALDLTLPESRDRVARVLAKVLGLECGSTAPGWHRLGPSDDGILQWELDCFEGFTFWSTAPTKLTPKGHHLPSLSTLDPSSDERLGDGSRWVDAKALKLVAEHVGANR